MPAVTVDDVLTLEPIAAAAPDVPARPVNRVTTAPAGYEGEGFPVRRAFAGVPHELLDPFIHMDQMGEVEYGAGEARGTSWHPHRGFETVTYMIDGVFEHQDSIGNGGVIRQRSDAVDDRRRRHPPHREATGSSRAPPAACSTACSCG